MKTLNFYPKYFKRLLAIGILSLTTSAANAAILFGDTVTFSFDSALLNSLFGSFKVEGDTLLFSPTQFVANVDGGGAQAIKTTHATTPLIRIDAKSGFQLTGLSLNEQGDYFRIESNPLSTFVGASGQFIVNNQAREFVTDQPLNNVTTFASLAGGARFTTTPWTVSESVALQAAANATVRVENVLVAGALSGGSAFIEKKLVAITASTIPLPAAVWSFGTALIGLLSLQARRTRRI